MNIIQTDGLTKEFKDVTAVRKVSMHVREGEIYGFLGLNGAGKTTLIRLLLGMINPTEGYARLFGQPVMQASAIWKDVGYLVETPQAYPNLSVRENLEIYYRLRGLQDRTLIDQVISRLFLDRYADRKAKNLSMGNKQRLGLAKALMHNPRLLLLDEPVNGLDPAGIVEIRDYLKDLVKNRGTTIFLSSHILSEIARLATRIGIVHDGNLINEIDAGDLEKQIIKKLCIDTVDNSRAQEVLKRHGFVAVRQGTGHNEQLEIHDEKAILHPEKIASLLVDSGTAPRMLYVEEEDLERYFLRIIGKTPSV